MEAYVVTAGDVHQHPAGAFDRGILEQGTGDGEVRCLHGSSVAASDPGAHGGQSHAAHDGANVREIEVDETGHDDKAGDALHRLPKHLVRCLEGVAQGGAAIQNLQQSLIGNGDQGVCHVAQGAHALLGLRLPGPALEFERLGDDAHRKASHIPGDPGDDRRRAGPRAAAHAGGNEHHVGSGQLQRQFLMAFLCGAATDLGIGARAHALRQFLSDLHPGRCQGRRECLQVRIDGHELDSGRARLNHVADSVATCAAYADDLNQRPGPIFPRGRTNPAAQFAGFPARR